jgi:terminase large subunit-like protein
MLTKAEAKKELARRLALKAPTFHAENVLFPEQLAFINDPARFATACTSVRAGKTVSCAADLIHTNEHMPGTTGLYITGTRGMAKRIVWPELLRLNREHKVGLVPNITELTLTNPKNGSIIYLGGANTEDEIEKYRGLSNVAVVYVDESQLIRHYLKELVEDVITKRLYDTNGRCRLIGTPGLVRSGYFYKVLQERTWSHHHWTLHQNIYLSKKNGGLSAEELIERDCQVRGVTREHPSIQRECYGIWADDSNSRVLNYDASRNHFEELPTRNWSHVMGIDVGFEDADAVAVLAYSDDSPTTYLVHEEVVNKQDLTSLAELIGKLQRKYNVVRSVIDEGGLGKKLAEELRKRWQLPLEPAEKTRKFENLALLNDSLRNSRFKARSDSRFAGDCDQLEIDRDKSTPDKLKISKSFHSDVIDAVLYAFKLSPAYSWEPTRARPVIGSREWFLDQSKVDWDAEAERLKREESGDGGLWPSMDGDWSKLG